MKAVFEILAALVVANMVMDSIYIIKYFKERKKRQQAIKELDVNKDEVLNGINRLTETFKADNNVEFRKWCMATAVRACTSGNAFVSFDTIKETYNDIYKIILQVEATDETSSR